MKATTLMMGLCMTLALSLSYTRSLAQSSLIADGDWHTISYSGVYKDHIVPVSNYPYIEFQVVGGDGGSSKAEAYDCETVVGGAGAIVTAVFECNTQSANFIQPGQTLRFIVGGAGEHVDYDLGGAAGGGGGSAILLYTGGTPDPYRILAVAGGGGGAYTRTGGFNTCYHDPGNSAQTGTSGGAADGDGDGRGSPGTSGNGAIQKNTDINYGGGGGGAYSDAYYQVYSPDVSPLSQVGKKGAWEGGKGGWQGVTLHGEDWNQNIIKGGYGFGGGGGGFLNYDDHEDVGPGGGGGYSGGANGDGVLTNLWYYKGSGGGGGSYVLPGIFYSNIAVGERTKPTNNGYIQYRFINFKTIHLASDTSKCLSSVGSGTANGTNIQLSTCTGADAHTWYFDGFNIRLSDALNKCVDLAQSNTTNANNIQLYDCNDTDAQHWVYDGVNKLIRSKININKCVHLRQNMTNPGTNIYIYDCSPGSPAQEWLPDGAKNMPPDTKVLTIRSDLASNKCIDLSNGSTSNGTNIQLWDCDGSTGSTSQQWYFDGLQLKLAKSPSKCLDLTGSSTTNSTNIQLYDCNNTDAQHWVFDGLTREIKSAIDLNKCIDVLHSGTTNGTNIQLYECNGTSAQHFSFGAVPCIMDTTPPVAKCKNAHFNQLIAPDASDINNGSYDNCAIKSMELKNASENGVFVLTVTDQSGNTCSCTGSVYFN